MRTSGLAWRLGVAALFAGIVAGASAADRDGAVAGMPNTARLSLRMNHDRSVPIGTKLSFRITAKKPGYVLLIDIGADGRMSQIFPSPEMLTQSREAAANFIKPGEELTIPSPAARKRGFEYVVTPPTGEAAMVAVLSDRQVQLLDLPDDAQKPRSEADNINYLAEWTKELRVPDAETGRLRPSNWSFDVRPYSISP
ncbi:DUF4384 domain-containing protein [Bradyrhizobium sp.]|uniref:DUF4384 domain-containing protein n=1 Tax=Bradyrhizobium sp. TaxID=376 RepID=UPI0025C22E9D|nr:DUF4384 domain-containing protein [Bradyrhizobium sp.]